MIRLIVHGARGRMGRALCALARDDDAFELAAEIDRDDRGGAPPHAHAPCDVVVDFSSDSGVHHAVSLARQHHAALLVGTTDLSSQIFDLVDDLARSVPVMVEPNFALGAAVLTRLALIAARMLGPEFHLDLIEIHHAAKRDRPSGTACRIARRLREQTAATLPLDRIHSVRAGDAVGQHSLRFSGSGEILELTHHATDRMLFARGALGAARWLCRNPPGRYTLDDMLSDDTNR